jgi:hypothetical protein
MRTICYFRFGICHGGERKLRSICHKLLCGIIIIAGLSVCRSAAAAASGADVLTMIDAAAQSGSLSQETALLYKVRAIRSPQSLPEPYRTKALTLPIRCGTPVVNEALRAAPLLSPEAQAEIAAAFERYDADSVYFTLSGHFAIHYDVEGTNRVPEDDLDANGIPDFVENLGLYFDSAWAYEVDYLGWAPPPSDDTAGGDSRYDVYPLSLGLTYGLTVADSPGPEPWSDYSSYIQVHSRFIGFPPNDDPEGDQAGAMKATAAHEFNHACQFAQSALHLHTADSWWQEISAVWMEDVVYDTVNDNYNYLDEFFPFPALSLFDGSYHKYGAFVLGKYIQENYGLDPVRQSWVDARYAPANYALDTALQGIGTDLRDTYGTFAGWNYFTGSRDDGAHYEEGARYLEVPITRVETSYPVLQRAGALIQSMAADYIELLPDPLGRDVVELKFNGTSDIDWRVAVWTIDSAGNATEFPMDIDAQTGDGVVYFGSFDVLDRALLVVANVEQTPTERSYLYSVDFLARADCNDDGGANIQDILTLVDLVYDAGPPPQPIWQVGDLDCSGGIDVLDVSVAVDYILRGGAVPCPPLE